MPYAVIDPDGNVRDVVPDVDTAVQVASQFSPIVQVENGPEEAGELGSTGGALGALNLSRPQLALKMCGIKPLALPTMSIEEAHALLQPYFPTQRYVKKLDAFVPIEAYKTPQGMIHYLLGQNYKTAKTDLGIEVKTNVKGLSILPAKSLGRRTIDGRVIPAEPGFAKINSCVGASPACIASCLVYSGHNTVDPYNAVVKAARHRALVGQPAAFVRILSEAIAKHGRSRVAEPYVRLNVFSDLPWELICPELFEAHPHLRFYDYTKVENRETPRNYDITFSFSGANKGSVAHELMRGRRVAVVFIPTHKVDAENRQRGEGLPEQFDADGMFGTTFGEPLEVVDGDVSDVRPRDPGQVIVGLRWKIPMGFQEVAFAQAQEAAFAVPVEDYDGILIAATSARNEPIHDADDAEDEDEVG